MSRIAPLDPPYADPVAEELTAWMPPGGGVEPLALFRTLARDLPLAEAMRPLGRHLLSRRSGLDPLAREVVIARVCARAGCSYEWGVHVVAFGPAAGLTEAQVAATAAPGVDGSLWEPRERALLAMVDELADEGRVREDTWQELGGHFRDEQLLTLLVLTGWYRLISVVANGCEVPGEPWAAVLPPPA